MAQNYYIFQDIFHVSEVSHQPIGLFSRSHERHTFLFEKVIIFTKRKEETVKHKQQQRREFYYYKSHLQVFQFLI